MSSLSTSASAILPTDAASASGRLHVVAAYLILVPLALSPLLWAAVPPLADYPNHLARMWILAQNGTLPALAANYVTDWRVLPDLAMDLVVPPLAQIMPLEIAGRLFIALTMLTLLGGAVTLHCALHGRAATAWPLAALLFLYNAAMFWGFLNCLFGAGMSMLVFSGWIGSRHWSATPRLAVFALAATALLFLHLFAFCFYGLAVGSYELGQRLAARDFSVRGMLRLCAPAIQFVPGLLLWLESLANAGPRYTEYGSLGAKVYAAEAPFTFGPKALALDQACLIFCLGFLILAILARAVRLAPEMRLTLTAMLAAAVAMPNWLSGSWLADIRLPAILPFLVIASVRLDASRLRAVGGFAAIAVVLLSLRIWAVSEIWRGTDPMFAEFRAASRVITPGARLLVVNDAPNGGRAAHGVPNLVAERWNESFSHMAALAIIDRSAFIPNLFTGWTSVAPTSRNAGLFLSEAGPLSSTLLRQGVSDDRAFSQPDSQPYWSNWPQHFDFVLWIDADSQPDPGLAILEPVARGSFFCIYKVARPA